jgi:hypothetical protein
MLLGDFWAQLTAQLQNIWAAIEAGSGPALGETLRQLAPLLDWLEAGDRMLLLLLAFEGLILLLIIVRFVQRRTARRRAQVSMARHRERLNLRGRRLAAEQGNPAAQNDLGNMYAAGEVLPRDYVRAHMWLSLAVAHGYAAAAEARDRIARLMTPEQVAEAEQRASDWRTQAG